MDDLNLQETAEIGQDCGQGSLLGIQPFMRRGDYASAAAFSARLRAYFEQARALGWISARTVVVLPEHLGTWLVTAGEPAAVAQASTIAAAARPIALRHLGPFLLAFARARESDRLSAALFRVKAAEMAQAYQAAFARLAQEFQVTIAAGTIVLPNPRVEDGAVRAGQGGLYNAGFLFHPDGRADAGISRKVYPIDTEQPFTTPGQVEDLPVYDTPAGRLAVLVCADSWYPLAYQRLAQQGAQLIAVPSAFSHGEKWAEPWRGYCGFPAPADVDPADASRLTEREAWGRYGLAGRIASAGAAAGINVFLYGDLWDLAFDGGLWRMVRGPLDREGSRHGPALINLWLE